MGSSMLGSGRYVLQKPTEQEEIKAILGVPHVFWGIKQISYTLIDVGHRMRKYLPSSIFTQYELLIRCST